MEDAKESINALEQLLVGALLSPEAQAQYERGAIAHETLKPLAEAVQRLSERYVSRQEPLPLSAAEATAYALYYTPVNAAKIRHLLMRSCAGTSTPARILDYGCGPGTASLIASYLFEAPTITAVDNAPAMRDIAARLLRARALETPLTWEVSTTFVGQFDLIIAANMLNELPLNDGMALLTTLVGALAPGGRLLTLEPALLETTRIHMGLRDAVLQRFPDLAVVFPCTHREPCPMLRHDRDEWCHAPLPWHTPRLVRQIDALTGFNKHRPKYSAFVFSRGAAPPPGIRILRAAEKSPKGATALACGPSVYGALTLLKRHKSDENRPFQKVEVFDRVTIDPPPEHGFIGADATVAIIERTGE